MAALLGTELWVGNAKSRWMTAEAVGAGEGKVDGHGERKVVSKERMGAFRGKLEKKSDVSFSFSFFFFFLAIEKRTQSNSTGMKGYETKSEYCHFCNCL